MRPESCGHSSDAHDSNHLCQEEGPFILEWIAYHQMLGITDFLFYSNDCTDGTDALLDGLAQQGHVVHLPNSAEGRNYQMEAL